MCEGKPYGFPSCSINPPQRQILALGPKSGTPGNQVVGGTQEGVTFACNCPPYPMGISSPLRGSDTGNKLRPSAEIFLSLSKNQTGFRQTEAPVPGAVTSASALPVEIVTAFISDLEKFS